jgi:hypothetical protein
VLEGWLAQWRKRRLVSSARPAVHGLTAHRLIQKARGGFSGAGLILATMNVSKCFAGSLKRPDHATLHGVVFDIFVERPIHVSETMLGRSDSGQAVRRAQQRSGLRLRAKMGG